jgi:hypothetical protein
MGWSSARGSTPSRKENENLVRSRTSRNYDPVILMFETKPLSAVVYWPVCLRLSRYCQELAAQFPWIVESKTLNLLEYFDYYENQNILHSQIHRDVH